MKKSSKSFEIALSAIACAFAAGFLMLGSLNQFLLVTGYLIATFAVMIPLSKNFTQGAFLCYLAAGLIAVWLSWERIVPYAVFFGLHPIVNYLQRKYVKPLPLKALCLALKAAWFDFSLWLSYYVLSVVAGIPVSEFVEGALYYVIFLGGTLFFIVYDVMIFYCQKSADIFIRRIRK